MLKSLLIIGAGSFSPEVNELARFAGYKDVAFLDDNPNQAYSFPVLGAFSEIKHMRERFDTAIVALGDNELRMAYHNELKKQNFNIPTLIHPTAYVSPDSSIAAGCIIRAKAVISSYASVGESTIINVGALIDHHVVIGEGCHILMGSVVRNMAKLMPMSRVESLCLVQ